MQTWKNPVITALAGLLVGFFLGWVLGQGTPAPPAPRAAAAADPHAGVPGAPPLSGLSEAPPADGRTTAATNARLLEHARQIEALLAKDPQNYDHLVQMGNVQYDMGNFIKAAEFYERARTIRDDNPDLLTDLGVAYRETNQPKRAVEFFDRAADLRPEHWQSRYNAAIVRLFDLNDTAGARMELQKLRKIKGSVEGIPDLEGLEQEIEKRAREAR